MKNFEVFKNLLNENSSLKVVCNGASDDHEVFIFFEKLVEDWKKNKKGNFKNAVSSFYDSWWEENAVILMSTITLSLIYNSNWNKKMNKSFKEEIILTDIISNLGGLNGKRHYYYLSGLANKKNNLFYEENKNNCYESKGFLKHFGSKKSLKDNQEELLLREKLKKIYDKEDEKELIDNGIHPLIVRNFLKILSINSEILLGLEKNVKFILKSYIPKIFIN
jgi:hypothetical protein